MSPLIFILSLEPLLNRLRANTDIQGITINRREFKVAAFADDILLTLQSPHITLPNLLKDINHFGILSNLKINYPKSHALNISLPPQVVTHCQDSFPFQWKNTAITYLGIQITKQLTDLYDQNFLPALSKIQTDLKEWATLNVSWFGRSALIKMIVLPRLLYLMQTIPIHLPPAFFHSYKKACTSFIWRGSPPRIKYSRLTFSKTKGGIALPDLYQYYLACHLTRVVDWCTTRSGKPWVTLENSFVPGHLHYLPWISSKHWTQPIKKHPLIYPSLLALASAMTTSQLSSRPGPLTSLRGNPDFPPGLSNTFLKQEWPHEEVQAHHFFHADRLRTYDNLKSLSLTKNFPFWTYRQLTHFLSSTTSNNTWTRKLTPLETLCTQNTSQRHLISTIYSLLQETPHHSQTESFHLSWHKDLHLDLTEEDWETIHIHTHKGSLNVAIQENGYKILTKWYRTPSRIHKFSPSIPNTCWRCNGDVGSMIHIWWECPILQVFWREVHDIIQRVTTYTLDFAPAQYLLHHTTLPKRSYHRLLAMHMVNAARLCIPVKWRSTSPPTIREWLTKIAKIEEMEELIYISQDRIQKFTNIWACWSHFKTTNCYKSYFPI